MNKITIILGLSLSIFLSGLSSAAAETLKIAALVNGEIISSEDLQNRINAFRLTTGIPYNNETRGMIRQRVLNAAIDEKLKLQEAAKNGIEITPEEINAQMRQFEKSNKIPMGQLRTILKQSGVSPETLSAQIKSDQSWIRLIRKKFYAEGAITQKEIETALKAAQHDLNTPKFQVLEIFIKKEHAKNISHLVQNLRQDPRFELYAMQFSESPSAANGGNLGWVNAGKFPVPLEKKLRRMTEGEISDPIAVGDGYYILKLQKTFKPDRDKPDIPGEKEIRTFLENQKMEALSRKLLQDLRQKAVIEVRD